MSSSKRGRRKRQSSIGDILMQATDGVLAKTLKLSRRYTLGLWVDERNWRTRIVL